MTEDVADHGLLDVSGLRLGEQLDEGDESAFARALERILAPGVDGTCNGFQASI